MSAATTNTATATTKSNPPQAKETLSQGNLAQSANPIDDAVIADSSKFDGTEQGIPDAVTELEILPELITEGLNLSQANQPTAQPSNSPNISAGSTATPSAATNAANGNDYPAPRTSLMRTPMMLKRNLAQGSMTQIINRSLERHTDSAVSSSSTNTTGSVTTSVSTASAKVNQKTITVSTGANSSSNSITNGNAKNNPASQARNSAANPSRQSTKPSNKNNQAANQTTNQSNLLRVIVYFDLESSDIKPEEARKLRQFWQKVSSLPNVDSGTISIVGHTDAKGENSFNIALSKERSESVTRFLETEGMDRDRYRVVFEGKSSYLPLQSNDTQLGRAMNRRVELRFKP